MLRQHFMDLPCRHALYTKAWAIKTHTEISMPALSRSFARTSIMAALLALASPSSPLANEFSDSFHVSAFGTLGLTHNDNPSTGILTSFAQKKPAEEGWSPNLDSVLGLQLEWRPLESTSVVVQGAARAGDDLKPMLRMAFLRQDLGHGFSARVGRMRSPLYFDSDVTEIGYAYLMTRPPIPLYGIANTVSYIDGVDIQWRNNIANAVVLAQGYYGKSGYTHYLRNFDSEADANLEGIHGLAISLITPHVTLRASRTWANEYTLRSDAITQLNQGTVLLGGGLRAMASNPLLPAGMAAALLHKAQQVEGFANPYDNSPVYTSLGFDATVDAWRLLGEATQFDSQSQMVGKYEGYQLTLGYNFDEFTPFVSIAKQRRKGDSLDLSSLAPTGLDPTIDAGLSQMQAGLAQASQYADISSRSYSLGVRWDFHNNMALKLQYDRIETPSAWTPGPFAVTTLPIDNKVNLFTATLDFAF